MARRIDHPEKGLGESEPEHPREPNLRANGLAEVYNVINIRGQLRRLRR